MGKHKEEEISSQNIQGQATIVFVPFSLVSRFLHRHHTATKNEKEKKSRKFLRKNKAKCLSRHRMTPKVSLAHNDMQLAEMGIITTCQNMSRHVSTCRILKYADFISFLALDVVSLKQT